MKQNKSILMRFCALALALILLVSGSNLGAVLQVFAAESDKTVTVAELVANNYELTDAEKALLNSGNLVGGTFEYDVPADSDLVAVDTEAKKITAKKFGEWVAASAAIVVSGEEKETVALTNGEGTYEFDENAFSVKVTYALTTEVDVAVQQTLLDAAKNLKTALNEMKAVYDGTDANLGVIVEAMPTLKDLAAGIQYSIRKLQFGEAAANAVEALDAQLGEGDEKLDLQDLNELYAASASKVQFLIENGAEYQKAIKATCEALSAIVADSVTTNDLVDLYLEESDLANGTAFATKWKALKSILNSTVDTLAVVSAWDASAVAAGADYAELDTLVAAIGTTTAVTAKNPLNVATTTIQKNLSMFNVSVKVVLNTVQENAVAEYAVYGPATVTLGKNATAEQIVAAVEKAGIDAAAKAEFGKAFEAEHYAATASELPEALTEDIEYVITYNPVEYTVTYGEGFEAKTEKLPYGYVVELEAHADSNKEYDYYWNGTKYAQGASVVVTGDTTVTREQGKAYTTYNLYSVIADTLGLSWVSEALKTEALKGNESFRVRVPDASEADELLTLLNGTLTAQATYDADYAGLKWVPGYAVEANSYARKSFNGGNTVATGAELVNVYYQLSLPYSAADLQATVDAVAGLAAEAQTQVETMARLVNNYTQMGSLDKIKLGALNGVIDVCDMNDDPAKLAELRTEFKTIVTALINNHLDGSQLKLYNMLTKYQDSNSGGLTYYYAHAQEVIDEVAALSTYLNGMTDNAEKLAALEVLCVDAGYPEYKDKIQDLGKTMKEVHEGLTAPNAMIDLQSKNLYKLIDLLNNAGTVVAPEMSTLVLTSPALTALDESKVSVQIKVSINGSSENYSVGPFDRGYIFTKSELNALDYNAQMFAANTVPGATMFYTADMSKLEALVGKALETRNTIIEINYVPKTATVDVVGEKVTVSINDLTIDLKAHEKAEDGYTYVYDVFGTEVKVNDEDVVIALSTDQLVEMFESTASWTITRKEVYAPQEEMDNLLPEVGETEKPGEGEQPGEDNKPVAPSVPVMQQVKNENGITVGIIANVAPNMSGIIEFVDALTGLGYSQIELNGEPLVEVTDKTLVSLQTLMNAMLNDPNFGSETLIKLAENGSGKLFSAKMNLGNSKTRSMDYKYTDLEFTFNFTSVPSQMVTVGNGLKAVKNYMSFKANNGVLDVKLDLPEKVYEIYLVGMMSVGEIDTDDMNAINNEIAYQFFRDYLDVIINSDATAQSFQNTLERLYQVAGNAVNPDSLPDIDLVNYSKYYDAMKAALTAENLEITTDAENPLMANVTASGMKAINKLLGLFSFEPEDLKVELAMIKEYQQGAAPMTVNVTASLVDTYDDYEALVIDASALKNGVLDLRGGVTRPELAGLASGIDFTQDLAKRMESVASYSAIVLMDDVNSDLVFDRGAIIDLNGHTINGNVVANAHVIILDSSLATLDCGGVNGTVSGKAHVIAGNYTSDVSAFLMDGYYQTETGAVRNVAYVIEKEGSNYTLVLDSDYMYSADIAGYLPSIRATAADIALDIAANCYIRAALSVDGNQIYNLDFDNLLLLVSEPGKAGNLVQKVLDCVTREGLNGFVNGIIDDLTNWKEMYKALRNDEVIGDYEITVRPWAVDLQYVAESDHVDMGIVASSDIAKSATLGIKIIGDNKNTLIDLIGELRDIVSLKTAVDLKKPTWDGTNNVLTLGGSAETEVYVDLTASVNYTNLDYVTMITVLLANGNPGAEADAMVAALNEHNMPGVKKEFDKMNVSDVIRAMVVLNKGDDFKALAAKVGVTLDVTTTDKLENLYHLTIAAIGKIIDNIDLSYIDKVENKLDGIDRLDKPMAYYHLIMDRIENRLERLDITAKTMGDLDKDGDGTYELDILVSRDPSVSFRGYTVQLNVEQIYAKLKVNIFGCRLGDVNHDGKVNAKDATLLLKYVVGKHSENEYFCEKGADVNGNGRISAKDATEILKYTVGKIDKFTAEK